MGIWGFKGLLRALRLRMLSGFRVRSLRAEGLEGGSGLQCWGYGLQEALGISAFEFEEFADN